MLVVLAYRLIQYLFLLWCFVIEAWNAVWRRAALGCGVDPFCSLICSLGTFFRNVVDGIVMLECGVIAV
jgi:hypothetical protein